MRKKHNNGCIMEKTGIFILLFVGLSACNLFEVRTPPDVLAQADTLVLTNSAEAKSESPLPDSLPPVEAGKPDRAQNFDTTVLPPATSIATGTTKPTDVVQFAQTLVGTPYVYAAANPAIGFDCSGFITYVFNHFGIAVPRSSIDFTRVGNTVPVAEALPGDLILFTGTDSTEKEVGHMGLVVSNRAEALQFIHSTSGKAKGVTITPLSEYYKKRFVRIARIFPQKRL